MKTNKKCFICLMTLILCVATLCGCKKEKNETSEEPEASILESEGDLEILIPDDQESGGE